MRSILLLGLAACALVHSFRPIFPSRQTLSSDKTFRMMSEIDPVLPKLGGKIVVTGIGKLDEDEFMLNLLNEQNVWSPVTLATEDSNVARKRFLSRTARYSGLLNVLEFETVDMDVEDQLKGVLAGANAWLAFNVSQSSVPLLAKAALSAGVKRFVVTTLLPPNRINDTQIPEFDEAIKDFTSAGASFTGIRHGEVIEGDENNPYEIHNATVRCLEPTVERGVLARVAAEILMIKDASNAQCGLSSSSPFSAAYLNVLRSSGLNRRQEVTKIFQGGIQKVARSVVAGYKEKAQLRENKLKAKEAAKAQEEKDEAEEKAKAAKALAAAGPSSVVKRTSVDPDASITPGWDEEQAAEETDEQRIEKRTNEILKSVWKEFQTRMYTKSTSMSEFFDSNKEKARELAEQEFEEEKLSLQEDEVGRRLGGFYLISLSSKAHNPPLRPPPFPTHTPPPPCKLVRRKMLPSNSCSTASSTLTGSSTTSCSSWSERKCRTKK